MPRNSAQEPPATIGSLDRGCPSINRRETIMRDTRSSAAAAARAQDACLSSMDQQHQQIVALLRQRRHREAGALLASMIAAAPGDRVAWTLLALAFALGREMPRLFGLIAARQTHFGDGLRFFHDFLSDRFQSGDDALIDAVAAATAENSTLAAVATYFAGCAAAARGDAPTAIASLSHASAIAACADGQFRGDRHLLAVLQDGLLLADDETLDRLEHQVPINAAGLVPAAPTFAAAPFRPPAERFVFLAACNEPYLDRFGEGAIRALDAQGIPTIFHLHIVAPSDALPEKIARLRAMGRVIDVHYSSEHFDAAAAGARRSAIYYACSRFIHAQQIMDRYERDALICDIDVDDFGDIRRAAAIMERFDIGWFERARMPPPLTCSAGFVYLRRTGPTWRCNELLTKLIRQKLADCAFWTLDQAALYSVSRYMARRHPSFRIADFTRDIGVELETFLHSAGTAEEKWAIRDRRPAPARYFASAAEAG